MSDSSEFIGSMPSIPPPKPQIQVPTQAAGETNLWAVIGFLFWSVCLLVFPTYAQTDELGSGIFYGMGLVILFISIIGLCQALARRAGRNRQAKAAVAQEELRASRPRRWISGVLVGIIFSLLGVYFLTLAEIPAVGDTSLSGLLFCMVGLFILSSTLIKYINNKLASVRSETTTGTSTQVQQRANTISSSIFLMLFAGGFMVSARIESSNAFFRGIGYGIGLAILFVAILSLSSAIARRNAQK